MPKSPTPSPPRPSVPVPAGAKTAAADAKTVKGSVRNFPGLSPPPAPAPPLGHTAPSDGGGFLGRVKAMWRWFRDRLGR